MPKLWKFGALQDAVSTNPMLEVSSIGSHRLFMQRRITPCLFWSFLHYW